MTNLAKDRHVVLAVDDDEATLDLFRLILEPEYEVLTTRSGTGALKILYSRRVDAALLDLLLPGMDGLEVLSRIRQVDPRVGVILVSALTQPRAVVEGIKLGAFDYLTKPFAAEDLLGLLSEIVNRRRADPGTVLVVGGDPGVLASFAVVLSLYVTVATAGPQLSGLPDPTVRSPLLVIYDCVPTLRGPLDFIERLYERYRCSSLVLLATETHISEAVRSRTTVIAKPYRLDGVFHRIATLVPGLEDLCVRSARLGSHLLRLVEFVSKSYREPLGTRVLALAAGCSVHHLAHIVRERLGISLMDYVTRFRFEVARHLLTVTDLTIEGVAKDSGFSSSSYLSRVFLQHGGYRPGDYRRQVHIGAMWPPPLKAQSSMAALSLAQAQRQPLNSLSAAPLLPSSACEDSRKLRAGRAPS